MLFLSSADFFSKSTVLKSSFRNAIRVSNNLDSDQVRHSVGPDLDPNCLLSSSADDTSKHRINEAADFFKINFFTKILL